MKKETKDDIKAGGLGLILVFIIIWALVGCTHTFNKPPHDKGNFTNDFSGNCLGFSPWAIYCFYYFRDNKWRRQWF